MKKNQLMIKLSVLLFLFISNLFAIEGFDECGTFFDKIKKNRHLVSLDEAVSFDPYLESEHLGLELKLDLEKSIKLNKFDKWVFYRNNKNNVVLDFMHQNYMKSIK